ncbi:hemerythrin isoform B [Chlorella sorokiniana]|uniref:Hemerythrin isoform B n=1 Tax=Chlorella sorokiniana TaxID=3076 RepID=A0A2P6U1V1_CHLSO|nr:hemerythrin isoform B [Chlorella sorokiniana]|eukprot:PRW60296.1 hemerythrin isoform B [Chlorella sorokiniana]
MAAPNQAAAAAEAVAAELAVSDAGGTGGPNFPEPSLIDCILCDHRHVSTLFAHFEAAAAAKQEHLMQMHAAALIQSIRMHSQAELEVVYPLVEAESSGSTDNAALAARSRQEHAQGPEHGACARQKEAQVESDLLNVLASVGCTLGGPLPLGATATLEAAMRNLQAHLIAHMLEEERTLLPRLAAAHSPEALVLLGKNFEAAKLAMSFLPPAAAAAPAAAGLAAATTPVVGVDTGTAGLEGKAPAPARVDTAEEAPMVM